MVAPAIDGNAGYHQRHGDRSHFIARVVVMCAVDPGTELYPTGKPDGLPGLTVSICETPGPGCMLHPVRHAGILGCRTRQRNICHRSATCPAPGYPSYRRQRKRCNRLARFRRYPARSHIFCHRVRNDGRQAHDRKIPRKQILRIQLRLAGTEMRIDDVFKNYIWVNVPKYIFVLLMHHMNIFCIPGTKIKSDPCKSKHQVSRQRPSQPGTGKPLTPLNRYSLGVMPTCFLKYCPKKEGVGKFRDSHGYPLDGHGISSNAWALRITVDRPIR